MLLCKYARQEAESKASLGVSAERFRGDAGRSLVPIDSPRHDAARISDLQAISRVLRRNRDEHIGRSLAEAASSRNHHHGTRRFRRAKAVLLAYSERNCSRTGSLRNGTLGSKAREYRQSSTCPANAKGQGAILG